MRLERVRDADRLVERRNLAVALLLGLVDAALHVAHGVEILIELGPVACAQRLLEAGHAVADVVEDAAVLPDARQPRGDVRAVG